MTRRGKIGGQWLPARRKGRYATKEKVRYIIYCEGERTEPNYFRDIKSVIEDPSNPRSAIYREQIVIEEPRGKGMNTESLVQAAIDEVKEAKLENTQVWIVYDKDDFSDESFNVCVEMAKNARDTKKNVEYKLAWSNQSFELWYVLHFRYLDAAIHRHSYIEILTEVFREHGIAERYEKNMPGTFSLMCCHGNPCLAVKYARKLRQKFLNEKRTPAKSCPCTKVDELLLEFLPYLPEGFADKITGKAEATKQARKKERMRKAKRRKSAVRKPKAGKP